MAQSESRRTLGAWVAGSRWRFERRSGEVHKGDGVGHGGRLRARCDDAPPSASPCASVRGAVVCGIELARWMCGHRTRLHLLSPNQCTSHPEINARTRSSAIISVARDDLAEIGVMPGDIRRPVRLLVSHARYAPFRASAIGVQPIQGGSGCWRRR